MATRSKRNTPEPGNAEKQIEFLWDASDEFIACRQQHDLPKFAPTKRGGIPRGMRAVGPYADGSYDLIRVCSSCGLEVGMYTGPGGVLMENKPRRKYPQGYLAKGIGRVSKRRAVAEGYARISDQLIGTAKPAPEGK